MKADSRFNLRAPDKLIRVHHTAVSLGGALGLTLAFKAEREDADKKTAAHCNLFQSLRVHMTRSEALDLAARLARMACGSTDEYDEWLSEQSLHSDAQRIGEVQTDVGGMS